MKFLAKIDLAAFKSVLDKIKEVQEPMNSRVAKQVAAEVSAKMKSEIASGKSPIAGRGNFQAYRGGYRKQIQKKGYVYSGGTKYSKQLKPVNLTVSGRFLESLRNLSEKTKNGYAAVITFTNSKSIKIEEGHRKGTNGQAERPILPVRGEKFSTAVQNVYLDIINESIARISKRK